MTIPLTLHYLGTERFGLWMTVSSIITMLAFADLGVGNGLLNAVASAQGRDDLLEMRRAISSASTVLVLIAVLVSGVFCASYPYVDWARLFNVGTPLAANEAGPATAAFFACFAMSIPITIVQRVQLGLQMGYVAYLWQLLGSALALILVLTAIRVRAGLPWLILSFAGGPVIANLVNGGCFFGYYRPDLRPTLSFASIDGARSILKAGSLFLVLQVVVAITYASDNMVIARVLGAAKVAINALPDRMFSVVPTIMSMILLPLWPAYGEAIARRDVAWARRVLKRTLVVSTACAAFMSLVLLVFGQKLLVLWTGHAVVAPLSLLVGMAIWKVCEAAGNCVAVYLNGSGLIKEQLAIALTTGIVAIAGKILLVNLIGVPGAIWATVLSYLTCAALPLFLLVRSALARQKQLGAVA